MSNGFQGLENQLMPEMPDSMVEQVTDRYVELYEYITGQSFVKGDNSQVVDRVEANIKAYLNQAG